MLSVVRVVDSARCQRTRHADATARLSKTVRSASTGLAPSDARKGPDERCHHRPEREDGYSVGCSGRVASPDPEPVPRIGSDRIAGPTTATRIGDTSSPYLAGIATSTAWAPTVLRWISIEFSNGYP